MATAETTAVLVTGATGKLGGSFVRGFAALGFDVAFTSRRAEAAKDLEKECLRLGARRAAGIVADLTAADAASAVARELAKKDMPPHVLIHNARNVQYLKPEPKGGISRANWLGELLLDVVLPYELTMAVADLPRSPLRSVINIASIYGVTAANRALYDRPEMESPVNYSVAKAGLIHLTKELAVRLAARKINVNAISYGGVDGRVDDAFRERYGRLCPSGRMLDDSEVFGAVKFLASDDARAMTGHNLVVDGGWTAW
jgi:hypothetical protein